MDEAALIGYYARALEFWYRASKLQQARCLTADTQDWVTARADVAFYVVCVQRIREVARMSADRGGLSAAAAALSGFDAKWPRFRELRNSDEHITLTGIDKGGIQTMYFRNSVCDLLSGGRVDYLLHLEGTQEDVEVLVSTLRSVLPVVSDADT